MPLESNDPGRPPAPRRGRARTRPGSAPLPVPDEQVFSPDLDDEGEAEAAAVAQRRQQAEAERRALFEALLVDDPFIDEQPEPAEGPAPHVLGVLVAHDGARWLPETIAAIAAQTRPLDHLVAVDTGSTDTTGSLLTRATGSSAVVSLPRQAGYGAAIQAALDVHESPEHDGDAARQSWIWLLHDDSAPDPTALAVLLDHAARNPSAGVLGVKAVDWQHPDRLVDVGLTTDRAGRRVIDLEHFELDQGQHDQPRDVLAVGTAGALIRRDVWDTLGGFDPRLTLLREDIDFGWRANLAGHRVVVVPKARVRHARATLTGRRTPDALPGRLHQHDRGHGLYVVLVNSGRVGGGLVGLPLVLVSGLMRALALLATRRPREMADELGALGRLVLHPVSLLGARHRRRATRTVPWSAPRPLLVRTGSRLRASLLSTTDMFAGSGDLGASGPPGEEEDLPGDDSTLLSRLFVRPVIGLVLALTVIGLVVERSLLQHGALVGGRLLQIPAGSSDLWNSYAASWHPGAWGSASAASPWEPVLAAVAFVFGGSPPLALTVLFLLALPLAGLSAWLATRRTTLSTALRLWAAVTYALLPVVSGAVAGGRFDAVVAVIAIPLLISGGHRLLTNDPGAAGWNHAFALGVGLAIAAAFSPPIWLLAAVALLGGAAWLLIRPGTGRTRDAVRRAFAAVAALLVTPLLLFPYASTLMNDPRELVVGLGVRGGIAGERGSTLGAADLLLLHPGGPLQPPVWFVVALLLAAGVGLLRTAWARAAGFGAAIAVAGYVLALIVARTGASAGGGGPYGWPGPALAFAGAGLLLAALVGARRARETYAQMSLGIRQPLGGLVAVLAIALPVASAVYLIGAGTSGPLERVHSSALPAFVGDDAQRDQGQRLLSLDTRGPGISAGDVSFTLTQVSGAQLGDEDLASSRASTILIRDLVADLTSNRGTDAAETLATFHVRYVAIPAADVAPGSPFSDLPETLDAQPALTRFAVPGPTLLWQVLVPSSRLELLSGDLASSALAPTSPSSALGRGPLLDEATSDQLTQLPSGVEGARASVPAASDGGQRLIVVSDSRESGWHATLDGHPLAARTAWNWAQAFEVPAGGGQLRIWHSDNDRSTALVVQAIVFGVVLVLAAPSVRRDTDGLDFDTDELDADDLDTDDLDTDDSDQNTETLEGSST